MELAVFDKETTQTGLSPFTVGVQVPDIRVKT